MSIVETVKQAAEPIVKEFGVELWDVEFKKEGSEYFLRVYIDRPEGVWVSDCEAVSRKLDPILDELDIIEHSYDFEVLSAGLVRELKTTEHLNRFLGKTVTVSLYKANDELVPKSKKFDAVLVSADDSFVSLEINGEQKKADRKTVAKITIDLV